MANNAWQQRIRRAEKLAAQYSFAKEILDFYIHIARFQQDLYQEVERRSVSEASGGGVSPAVSQGKGLASRPLAGQPDAAATASFPEFLKMVEKQGPERLVKVARDLRAVSSSAWSELLNGVCSAEEVSSPEQFLAVAFLQPYAEFARARAKLEPGGYTNPVCPFCNRRPALGILRQQGDGARRSLLCGFCLTEWEFRRIICPGCGEEGHAKLPVYTAEAFPHIRVECCDTCQTYIKSIDLTKNGLAEPLVDELASVPLNLWAQERGYVKSHPNLLGM